MLLKGVLELKLGDNIGYLEKQAKVALTALEKFSEDHLLP
ncbi:unnamed protein product, partial [Didymodactylos carnosus]